jgi:hypothetical protein
MLRIQPPKPHVVRRIQHHRDPVPLPHPHPSLHVIAVLPYRLRLHHLRRKDLRIAVEVPQYPLKIRRLRPSRKCRPAPAVQQRSRQLRTLRRSHLLHHHLAPPQPRPSLLAPRLPHQKSIRRPMLLRQPRLNHPYIIVEAGYRRRRSLRDSAPGPDRTTTTPPTTNNPENPRFMHHTMPRPTPPSNAQFLACERNVSHGATHSTRATSRDFSIAPNTRKKPAIGYTRLET